MTSSNTSFFPHDFRAFKILRAIEALTANDSTKRKHYMKRYMKAWTNHCGYTPALTAALKEANGTGIFTGPNRLNLDRFTWSGFVEVLGYRQLSLLYVQLEAETDTSIAANEFRAALMDPHTWGIPDTSSQCGFIPGCVTNRATPEGVIDGILSVSDMQPSELSELENFLEGLGGEAVGQASSPQPVPQWIDGTPTDVATRMIPVNANDAAASQMLRGLGIPDIDQMRNAIADVVDKAQKELASVESLRDENNRLRTAASTATLTAPAIVEARGEGDGKLPKGEIKKVPAHKALGIGSAKSLGFDIPVWEWEFPHPHVPARTEHFDLSVKDAMPIIWNLLSGENNITVGHTGTGKTTAEEEVAARINNPLTIISMDSNIQRDQLMGSMELVKEGETTVTRFAEGIVVKAMQQPGKLILDEIDATKPEAMFAIQRVLQTGKELTLIEDGGRIIKPHPWFRLGATANTKLAGDEHGIYHGTRVQSGAMADRITIWHEASYMTEPQMCKLLKSKFASLTDDQIKMMGAYWALHVDAFLKGQVELPLSPRGMQAWAKMTACFSPIWGEKRAIEDSFASSILKRASDLDAATMKGFWASVKKPTAT